MFLYFIKYLRQVNENFTTYSKDIKIVHRYPAVKKKVYGDEYEIYGKNLNEFAQILTEKKGLLHRKTGVQD